MNIKNTVLKMAAAATVAIASTAVSAASTTVVNFDDLSGYGVLGSYAGIEWTNWNYYGFAQNPYNAASGSERIYDMGVGSFSFASGVVFDGAKFAGYAGGPEVSFELFYQGNVVHTSDSLSFNGTPTFLSSGYAGLVDKVTVLGPTDNFVMDDVTYSAATAVPEPANVALMLGGMLLVAGAVRRSRQR